MIDQVRRSILGGAAGGSLVFGAAAISNTPVAQAESEQVAYGLIGDGVADDSAALERAFTAAFGRGGSREGPVRGARVTPLVPHALLRTGGAHGVPRPTGSATSSLGSSRRTAGPRQAA